MRRAVFAILGTAAATSLLVGLKAHAEPQQPSGSGGNSAQQEPPPESAAPADGQSAPPDQPTVPPANNGKRTIKGDSVSTPYGDVTVTITLTGNKITDITAVLPTGSDSATVKTNAGPKLKAQALAKQSADIDTVSGATYTSEGYKASLQSALDRR
jgi:uncharacterized protein with FMN-binding domain